MKNFSKNEAETGHRVNRMMLLDDFNGGVIDVEKKQNMCPWCGRRLFDGELGSGSAIEIKCIRCKQLVKLKKL